MTREATAFFCLGERIRVNNARAFNERASRVATNARGQRKREREIIEKKIQPPVCVYFYFLLFFFIFLLFSMRASCKLEATLNLSENLSHLK